MSQNLSVRLLLDATSIPADRGGVGRYLEGLLSGLTALDPPGLQLHVACQQRDTDSLARLAPAAELHPLAGALEGRPVRLAWEQSALPVLVSRVRADVVHSPHYTMPVLSRRPVVVTMHDATFFSDPAVHRSGKARFFRTWTRVSLGRASRVIVPSRASAESLVRCADGDPRKVVVVPHGVDPTVFRPPRAGEVARLRDRLGLADMPFVAFLGTLEPRKNVPALVRAWSSADSAAGTALVLAGGPGWDTGLAGALAAVPADRRLVRPGYLPVEDLPALLGGAEMFVYPSLGEGFGLPVLEAMACGAAVLTTRRLALPEVGGDAVEYTEPDDDSLRHALARLLGDPAARDRLRPIARERARLFTWTTAAAAHLRAYGEARDG